MAYRIAVRCSSSGGGRVVRCSMGNQDWARSLHAALSTAHLLIKGASEMDFTICCDDGNEIRERDSL